MNQSAKLGLGVGAALALAALFGFLLLGSDDPAPGLPSPGGGAVSSGPAPPSGFVATPSPGAQPTAASGAPRPSPSATPSGETPRPPTEATAQLVIRGRVVEEGGAPISGAAVVLWGAARPETGVKDTARGGIARRARLFALRAAGQVPFDLVHATSGAGGAFSLGPLAIRPTPGARLNLSAEVVTPEGDVRVVTTQVVIPGALPAGGVDAGDVVLEKLPALRFVVRGRGRPVEGARITLLTEVVPPGWSAAHPRPLETPLRTDVQGRAGHATRAPRVAFRIAADGFATEHGLVNTKPQGVRVSVELDPTAPVEGLVVDAEGRPVAGASVTAYEAGGGQETGFEAASEALRWIRRSGAATSDEAGRFSLPGLAAKRSYWVYASPAKGDIKTRHGLVEVKPPQRDLRLTLQKAASLQASAQLPPGAEPPARVSFVLQRRSGDAWEDLYLQHVTPPPGQEPQVHFARIPPGTLRVAVHAPGFAPVVSEPLQVTADEDPGPLTLPLQARGRTLTGKVTDAASRPLPGALVAWRDFGVIYGVCDGQGRFRLTNLPADPLNLSVTLPGYQPTQVEVPAGTTRLPTVTLRPAR